MSGSVKFIAAVWVISTLAVVAFSALGVDAQFRLYYSNALQTLTSLASAAVCFYSMRAFPAGSPLRKVWGAIGLGVLAWGLGATIFSGYPLLHGGADTPYPYYSDIGYLATPVLIIVGLVLFKRSIGMETPIWGQLLSAVMFFAFLVMAYHANAEGLMDPSPAMKMAAFGYTVFDPALMATTILTATSFRGGEVGKSWWFVVAGIVLYFIANQLYTYLLSVEQYTTGHPIDIGWMLGFGLIAWAALKTRRLVS